MESIRGLHFTKWLDEIIGVIAYFREPRQPHDPSL